MRRRFLTVCFWADRLATWACALAALVLAASVLAVVLLRQGFDLGYVELQEAAGHAFAILAIFSVPVCLARDGHVRVDVLSERLPPRYLRAVDTLALVAFLIPVFVLMIWAYLPHLAYSWSIREASIETGGLGGLYLVKTALPVAAALTILQGIAAVLRFGDTA